MYAMASDATPKTTTRRTTTAKKPAASRSTTRAAAKPRAKAKAPQGPIEQVGAVAERVVLTGVGAALVARDSLERTIAAYTTPAKRQARLRKFERRGAGARSDVLKALEARRADADRAVSKVGERVGSLV